MKCSVRFKPDDCSVSMDKGTPIIEAANVAGVDINSSCGGKGTCKKCKVIVEGSTEISTKSQLEHNLLDKGYRLACQTYVTGDVVVFVPEEARLRTHQILASHRPHGLESLSPLTMSAQLRMEPPDLMDNLGDLERLARAIGSEHDEVHIPIEVLRELPNKLREGGWKVGVISTGQEIGRSIISLTPGKAVCNYGAALDVGTTTVVLSLVDLSNGKTLVTASDYNKQTKAGDDVISRISYAEEGGLETLKDLIIQTVNHLLFEARASAGKLIGQYDITALSVAGNTTMMHLFLGLDPKHIRYDPYVAVTNLPPIVKARDLNIGINPEAPVYFVPGRASFVGGDITADIVASGLHNKEELALLIDVGTNGEVVLGGSEFLVACSTSAGPAFEGGEVASGMRAMSGAIERLSINNRLEVKYSTIGEKPALGICGSGLIDLVAQMFLRRLIDKKGRIQESGSKRVRRTDEGRTFLLTSSAGKEIVISDSDLANIIRTKAAMFAGCSVLLKSLDKSFLDLDRVYIAGGFGNHIDVENAITIGLLPDIARDRFQFIGNAALAGAVLTLLSEEKRKEARRIYEDMTYLELTTSQTFFDEFSSASFLPHTDISKFPTVRGKLASEIGRK